MKEWNKKRNKIKEKKGMSDWEDFEMTIRSYLTMNI